MAPLAQGVLLDDRYRLAEIVGQGGMATVYRAHDTVLDRDVAVKLFPAVSDDPEQQQRHQAEMRVLAQLSHPGLVTLHDAGSSLAGGPTHQTYLVMELVDGQTLAERLLDGPVPPRHVARLGRQIAEALAVVHAADVVHRDIKPANVLLADRDRTTAQVLEDPEAAFTTGPIVKLADFGIARLSDGARLTATGTTLGTATYLSPEQASGGAIGPASDIYALGLVLLECLTGRKAFTGTVVEVAAARLTRAPEVPEELGPGWVALLTAMTRREPGDRPAAGQVALALAHLADDSPLATPVAGDTAASGTSSAVGTGPAAPGAPAPVGSPAGHAASGREVHEATHHRPAAVEHTRALLPAAIPPRVPPAPPRRRRVVDEADGTRQYSTAEIRAAAERSAQSPRDRPSAGSTPLAPAAAAGRGRRRRRAVLVAAGSVVAVAGTLALGQAVDGGTPTPVDPPTYPAVDGPLGDALVELQDSVAP